MKIDKVFFSTSAKTGIDIVIRGDVIEEVKFVKEGAWAEVLPSALRKTLSRFGGGGDS